MTFWQDIGAAFKGAPPPSRPRQARSTFATGAMFAGDETAPLPYMQGVDAAYARNAVAQRAVRIVADGAGSTPISVAFDGDASDDAATEITELVLGTSAGQSLVETLAAHLLLHGNAYVQLLGAGGSGVPGELFALRPDRVEIEADAAGWPAAYRYRAGETAARIERIDGAGRPRVVHIKAFHPADDHYGLGCLGAAGPAVAVHNAATAWNRALLANAARPSGALVVDAGDGTLTEDQFDKLRGELEASYAGMTNAGRPMLLEGGLRWQAMSLTPADMDFIALKENAAREIALAFGVPPMLLGLPGDKSYANYREANRALWRLTILPLADKILGALAQGLRDWWPGLRLSVDRDQVPALSEDRERLWAQVAAADFLTDAEKRGLLGIA